MAHQDRLHSWQVRAGVTDRECPKVNTTQFVAKWRRSARHEHAAYLEHFLDLCDLFDFPKPGDIDPEGKF